MRRRAALILMALGVVLAGGASVLVLGITRQANEASRARIPQVYVVMATRDLADQALITADALVVRPFPADFVPPGAVASADEAVGKFAVGPIFKDQIIHGNQLASTKRSPNLSDRVPPGKVVVWLPMPELLATQSGFRPGDRMDILLSLPLVETEGAKANGPSTQTTLQNVEVFAIGTELPAGTETSVPAAGATARNAGASGARPLGFLVDHQDAVIIKFIKDSGGVIDLVLRSTDEDRVVRTDAMTVDSVAERFRFRVPQGVKP
jgi:pilus assembly protein CpaB